MVVIFKDRTDAGRLLAEKLAGRIGKDGVVLAIPRGGVVVGAELARKLGLKLDLIIPRKIGSPQNPEVALGAIAQDGAAILDRRLIELLGVTDAELKEIMTYELEEIKRRMSLYRGSANHRNYTGKQIVVVDDGIATGYTMLAALRSARNLRPRELILAIPVAPPETLEILKKEVEHSVCLLTPANFYAVGQFYESFDQTDDEEVVKILKELKEIEK